MGLFRKKNEDNSHLEALRAEVDSMRERLDSADRANAELAERLSSLDQSNAAFEQRFDMVDNLSVHVQELAERTGKVEQEERAPLLVSTPTPPPPPPVVESTSIDEDRLAELATKLEELSATVAVQYTESTAGREQMDAVDDLNERFGEIAERVSTIDSRVTNVSFELANQLTELSRDIEAINEQRSSTIDPRSASSNAAIDGAIDDLIEDQIDSALDEVRDTTEKLAVEQARYEIQFRADLADLADRLRRPDE